MTGDELKAHAKAKAKEVAEPLARAGWPREHVEKGMELLYREAYVAGAEDALNRVYPYAKQT